MSDDTKVVDLSGRPVSRRTEPVPAIVAEIEKLLEEARSGDLRGFAAAAVRAESIGTVWAYDPTSSMKFEILAAADLLQTRILRSIEEAGADR